MRNSMSVFLLSVLLLTGCGEKVKVGDTLYISKGYKERLVKLNLVEVVPMPYFQPPFITVAKDSEGNQYALIFRIDNTVDKKALEKTYEHILGIFKAKGLIKDEADLKNIHLFEIDGTLYWNFSKLKDNIYLDTLGVEKDPF